MLAAQEWQQILLKLCVRGGCSYTARNVDSAVLNRSHRWRPLEVRVRPQLFQSSAEEISRSSPPIQSRFVTRCALKASNCQYGWSVSLILRAAPCGSLSPSTASESLEKSLCQQRVGETGGGGEGFVLPVSQLTVRPIFRAEAADSGEFGNDLMPSSCRRGLVSPVIILILFFT